MFCFVFLCVYLLCVLVGFVVDVKLLNVIYIFVDDFGYGELGVYGQEKIEILNIDVLAWEGMCFIDYYSSVLVCVFVCYMLFMGQYVGYVYICNNDEGKVCGDVWNYWVMFCDFVLEG